MNVSLEHRRYLSDFDSAKTGNILADVLVIGTGVAGLRAAIAAAQHANVLLVCKKAFESSATQWAQGGIAAPVDTADSVQAHIADTLRVGCGYCRPEVVQHVVAAAAKSIQELIDWGLPADRAADKIALGREGGHSHNRIVHAGGDRTGRALVGTLRRKVEESDRIRVFEHCFVVDLLTTDGRCIGAVTQHERFGHQLIWAPETILASGGCGRIWRETTNPEVSTGDGIAAAFRAGARLCNLEFMQFHPTTLYVAGAGRTLISETVRGEGAHLVDRGGQRFMLEYDPAGELAPRDIVSRSIHQHLQRTKANCVYLDVRHISGFAGRFPEIARLCADFQIDVTRDLIPVRPSAHYMIGGVDCTLDGTTSIPGLRACGEAACSGLHGANRLASNSLLEGAVLGAVAGAAAGQAAATQAETVVRPIRHSTARSDRTELHLADIRNSLRSVMWRNVGIIRRKSRLAETCQILDFWAHYTLDKLLNSPEGWEVQNELTVARLIAGSALARTESVGVHFREDDACATATVNGRAYETVLDLNEGSLTVVRRPLPRATPDPAPTA